MLAYVSERKSPGILKPELVAGSALIATIKKPLAARKATSGLPLKWRPGFARPTIHPLGGRSIL
jgi:hypothetical protein